MGNLPRALAFALAIAWGCAGPSATRPGATDPSPAQSVDSTATDRADATSNESAATDRTDSARSTESTATHRADLAPASGAAATARIGSSPFVEPGASIHSAASIGKAGAPASVARSKRLLVVIDPGHGGDKQGAVGPNRLQEKDAALAISLALRDELLAMGHRALLTRDDDRGLGLMPRVRMANELGADVFVSVHLNAMPGGASASRTHGVETYFLSADASDAVAAALARAENDDDVDTGAGASDALGAILADLARTEAHAHSSRLALAIHTALVRAIGARDRGLRQAPFVVLQGADMPAVLVEVGYVSHPAEARRLADPAHQHRIAAGIAKGIGAFGVEVVDRESPQSASR